MSSIENDTVASRHNSETIEVKTAADAYNTPRTSNSGFSARRREQEASGRKLYDGRSKAKLQKLREKVKVHQHYVEEQATAQPARTAPALTATSTARDSTFPLPATENNACMAVDFSITPPNHLDADHAAYRIRAPDQGNFWNSLPSPEAGFTYATPSLSWDTLHGSYGPQEPLTPGLSCSASGVPIGLTIDDPFCPTQSLQDLHGDDAAPPQFSTEHDHGERGDSRRPADVPDSAQCRVRHVMEQAAAVGFETLDEVVATYYTESFEDMPSLYQEQRLSRNRRLPRLLSTLHGAAKGWSEWERRGFQEQITLGAEEVLVQELNTFLAQQRMATNCSRSADNGRGEARTGNTLDTTTRRRNVQNDLPNLWALTTALLARTDPSRHENRSDTVLAIIETLCRNRAGGPGGDEGLL